MPDHDAENTHATNVATRTVHIQEEAQGESAEAFATAISTTTTITTITTTTTTSTSTTTTETTTSIDVMNTTVVHEEVITMSDTPQGETNERETHLSSPKGSDIPGANQDTHHSIPFTSFIKDMLNTNDIAYNAVHGLSHRISKKPAFQRWRMEYLSVLDGRSSSTSPEKSLMQLFTNIKEAARSNGLKKPYPLDVDYIVEYPATDGMPLECAALLHSDQQLGEGGWPLFIIQMYPPATTPFDVGEPTPPVHTHPEHDATGDDGDNDADDDGPSTGHKHLSPPPSSPSSKRRRVPPPPKFNVLSSTEMPSIDSMTQDAFKVMSGLGTRRHIFGVLVRGLDMFLGYFDRAGTVFSTRLHLFDDTVDFIEAVLSLALCTPTQLGFEHYIFPPPGSSAPTNVSGCTVEVEGRELVLDELVHSSDTPFGRGTTVFSAHPSPADLRDAPPVPDEVIVKFAWQETTQESEDKLFRHAAKYNVEGVAKLYLSSVITKLSDGIRGKVMGTTRYVDRELRVQVMGPRCMPLYRVVELEDFKAAFISLVKAHHDLYHKAGILHRDISINNLMVEPSNPRVGVLIDLDLAAIVKDKDGNDVNVKPILTGTVPFLAVDLLRDTPPPKSLYRHDLESFFYVLLWIISHYNRGEEVSTEEFDTWYNQNWEDIAHAKLGFVTSRRANYTTPHFRSLERSWLPHLCLLFTRGFNARADHESNMLLNVPADLVGEFDDETLGGHVVYRKFWDILSRIYK